MSNTHFTPWRKCGWCVCPASKLCILSRGRRGERLNLRFKYIFFFFPGKREYQDRERAEPVFLFSHSVLLNGCLTKREQLLKKKRGRLKAFCSLAKASKPSLPSSCPFWVFLIFQNYKQGCGAHLWPLIFWWDKFLVPKLCIFYLLRACLSRAQVRQQCCHGEIAAPSLPHHVTLWPFYYML